MNRHAGGECKTLHQQGDGQLLGNENQRGHNWGRSWWAARLHLDDNVNRPCGFKLRPTKHPLEGTK